MEKIPVGKITHVFPKISVAVLELTGTLKVGDRISIEGKDNAFEQPVNSMQIEHTQITEAKAGQAVGLKTTEPVHEGSMVYKVTP
ncbi:Uncharacterised protein [uncultured archaeon]|nr:Uncharacterised protein [uncultured archaeon]